MAINKSMWFVLMVAVSMVLVSAADPPPSPALRSCYDVFMRLLPCQYYLTYGDAPSADCCSEVRPLYNQPKDTPVRKAICSCLTYTGPVTPPMITNLPALPGKCGLNVPIDDCSRV